jgi:FkbM family methyltransferase
MSIGIEGRLLVLSLLPRWLRRWVMKRRYRREVEATGEAELPYLRRILRRGDLAVDVGCNLGVYTYEMSRVSGRVIAFEPNPGLAGLVRGLNLEGVELRQAAASDQAQEAELFIPDERFGFAMATLRPFASLEGKGETIRVSAQRLDDIREEVRFVKIDVEGFEEQALAGAENLLVTVRPIFLIEIEERYNPGGLTRIAHRMRQHGYAGFFLQRGTWHPLNLFVVGEHQDVNEDDLSGARTRRSLNYINNFLFVPDAKIGELDFLA